VRCVALVTTNRVHRHAQLFSRRPSVECFDVRRSMRVCINTFVIGHLLTLIVLLGRLSLENTHITKRATVVVSVLYCRTMASDGGSIAIPKLTTDNYASWKNNCRFLLKEKGLWAFVDGTEPALSASATSKDTNDIIIGKIGRVLLFA